MAGQEKDPFEGLGQFADYFRKSPFFNQELAQQQRREEAQQRPQQPEQQPLQESKTQEADSTPKLSPEDQDLAGKIRQVEEETRSLVAEEARNPSAKTKGTEIRRGRISELLKPLLGGKEPSTIIHVCHIPNKDTGTDYHTHYYAAAEAPLSGLPDPKVLPPHLAQLFTRGMLEPCLEHTIEMSIGVTGPWVSQKKIVPYELLPSQAKNQLELERLVTAATEDYALVGKEIQLPLYYTRERRRKIAAVVFKNAELYKSEEDRKQVAQLLQQIDAAISLRAEGKVGEEEVRTLIARLREKPTVAAPQIAVLEQAAQQVAQQQLEGTVSEAYVQGMYAIPAKLKHGDMINAFLRRFEQPYEVALEVEAGLSLFRFTKPGLDKPEAVEKARDQIQWLETVIGTIRGIGTKEGREQKITELLPTIYQRFSNPEQK